MLGFENIKDKEIIQNVLDTLDLQYESHKYYNDGASSRVILLNDKYLIKQNDELVLKAEVEFLKLNNLDIFQDIVYVDPKYQYVVYTFIHGDIMKVVDAPKDTIQKLAEVCGKYKVYGKEGYGYLNEEIDTWKDFLISEIEASSKNISEYIQSKDEVYEAAEILDKYLFEKKLIHGDFGTHNFVKVNGKLIGIIDPMPVIGDPLYDLLFAIVSNTDLLTSMEIEEIYTLTNEPREKVKALFKIVLYSRISRCLKYHPKDIDTYMKYWNVLNNKS